jgi:transcription elongation GreA/GreB family factor
MVWGGREPDRGVQAAPRRSGTRAGTGGWSGLRADDDRTALHAVDIPADGPMATALPGRRAGDRVHVELGPGVDPLVITVERVV